MGEKLNLRGEKLMDFVERQLEKEREREIQIQREEKEREFQLQREERDRESQKEIMIIQHKQMLELKDHEGNGSTPSNLNVIQAVKLKMPYFDERHDDLDTYLTRFERLARVQKWEEDTWGIRLGTLLRGKALEVYNGLVDDEATSYEALTNALRAHFRLTPERYREKLRNSKRLEGETFQQFVVRLETFLKRWLTLSEKKETFEDLKDLILREQLMSVVPADLATFIRERNPATIQDAAGLAQHYVEARKTSSRGVLRTERNPDRRPQGSGAGPNKPFLRGESKGSSPQLVGRTCYYCHSPDHLRHSCPKWKRDRAKEVAVVTTGECSVALSTVPALCGPCSEKPYDPNCQVMVEGKRVSALRDTGATTLVVQKSLVPEGKLTGRTRRVEMADSSLSREVPVAVIGVETPFFVGQAEAVVMENPVRPLLIGNMVRDGDGREHSLPVYAKPEILQAAVETRAQSRRGSPARIDPVQPLKRVASREELMREQQSDPLLERIRGLATKGEQLSAGPKGRVTFFWKKGVLCRSFQSGSAKYEQVVVPSKLHRQVMSLAHDSAMAGHMGVKRTLDRVQRNFYWPGVNGDVRRFVSSCDACQRVFPRGKVKKMTLGKMPLIGEPFRRVGVDLVGPIVPASEGGHRYLLVMVDFATRYPEAVALKSVEAESVAEGLIEMWTRVGGPKEMLTDRGSQFVGGVMSQVRELLNVKGLVTTPYHAQCNGLVERMNGTLKTMLRKLCKEQPRTWNKWIPALLFAYREVPQESLGFSPFELLYGRTVRGPMQILKELWSKEDLEEEVKTTAEYVVELRNRLEETCALARRSLQSASARYAKHFDKKAKARRVDVGSKVLLLPCKQNKLELAWQGPFEVVEKVGECDYRLDVRGKQKLYHINLLKPYLERVSEPVDRVAVTVVDDTGPEAPTHGGEIPLIPLVAEEGPENVKLGEKLNGDERKDLLVLAGRHRRVLTDLPLWTDLIECELTLLDSKPVFVKQYPLPFSQMETVTREVKTMLSMGVIEPAVSPYSAPIVLVKKNDGKVRFCVDYRRLNQVTAFDAEPLPDMDYLFSRLSQARYLSKIDLSKGYWQVPMRREDRPKTAFTIPVGQFQWRVMPFGLQTAVAVFSRMMRRLLGPLERDDVTNFMDDILVATVSFERHLETLDAVFCRLREANLSARPTKCFLGFEELDYLGHRVGRGCLWPDPGKVEKILAAGRPVSKKGVRSFLGLVGYYRKFVPYFADVARPSTDLTKGPVSKIEWTAECEAAFKALKEVLSRHPVMKLPDLGRPFVLRTDASDTGLGAVLLQEQEGELYPVAYASKKLAGAEQRYAAVEKECLAIVWAVGKFELYLYGQEFTLETDHQSLQYLHRVKVSNGRLMRWSLLLQPFQFQVRHIKGCENLFADFLSRH